MERPHAQVVLGGAPLATVVRPTLALLDPGATCHAMVSRGELQRLGWGERKVEPMRRELQLTAVGGGRIRCTGTVILTPTVAGLDERARTRIVQLPPVRAVVVEEKLRGYGLLLGVRYLAEVGETVPVRQNVAWVVDTTNGPVRVPLALEPQEGEGEGEEAAALEFEEGQWAEVAAAHDEQARAGDREWVTEVIREMGTSGDAKQRRETWDNEKKEMQNEIAWLKDQAGTEIELLRRRTRAKGPKPPPQGKGRRVEGARAEATLSPQKASDKADELAKTIEDEYQRSVASRVEQQVSREREEKGELLERWVQKLRGLEHDSTLKFTDGEALGAAVLELDANGRRRLAALLQELKEAVLDPRTVPRRADARQLPVQVVLDIDPAAKPYQGGVARSFSPDKAAAIVEQLETLLAGGLVERINDPTWVHGVVLARKPDGRWRFAIDYRPLNAAHAAKPYPLPDPDELLRELAGAKVYTTFDLSDAFYQLVLREEDRHFTGFHVPGRGTYQWRVMPMGLRTATAVWQANMEQVLEAVLGNGTFCYVDDLVVFADNAEQLLQRTEQVHALLAAYDLRLSAKKVRLMQTEIPFLGRVVRHGGIGVAPKHIEAIAGFARPATAKELQRFLGMINYHRAYVPRLGDDVARLVRLERRSRLEAGPAANGGERRAETVQLQWDKDDNDTFEALRSKMTTPPVLTVPDMAKLHGRIRIDTDAATTGAEKRGGLGGAVYWRADDDTWRLVQVYSRVLNDAEGKYAAVEAELLAAVETVRAAGWLLRKATGTLLVTDHQAVTYVGTLADCRHGRLARWAARLLEYDLQLAYRAGKDAIVPDALSRAPIEVKETSPYKEGEFEKAGTVQDIMRAGGGNNEHKKGNNEQNKDKDNKDNKDNDKDNKNNHKDDKDDKGNRGNKDNNELAELCGCPATSRTEAARRRLDDVREQLRAMNRASADVLVIDYPWRHDSDPQERFFRRMQDGEWRSLWEAVGHVAAEDAVVVIDVPVPMLAKLGNILALEEAAGWRYHTALVWDRGRPAPSRNWPTQQHELFAVCSRGNYAKLLPERKAGDGPAASLSAVIEGAAREVARKPDQLYRRIEDMLRPGLRRLDVFARERRPGWTAVGDEVDKFNNEVAAANGGRKKGKTHDKDKNTGHDKDDQGEQAHNDKDNDDMGNNNKDEKGKDKDDNKNNEHAPAWLRDIDETTRQEQAEADERRVADPYAAARALLWTAIDETTRHRLTHLLNGQDIGGKACRAEARAMTAARTAQAKAWARRMGARIDFVDLPRNELAAWVKDNRHLIGKIYVAKTDEPTEDKHWFDEKELRKLRRSADDEMVHVPVLLVDAARKASANNKHDKNEDGNIEQNKDKDDKDNKDNDKDNKGNIEQDKDNEATPQQLAVLPCTGDGYAEALMRWVHRAVAHAGVHGVRRRMEADGWYIIDADARLAEVVVRCVTCGERKGHPASDAQVRAQAAANPTRRVRAAAFNDIVHVDHVGPLYTAGGAKRWLLSFTDNFTRWPEVVVVESVSAKATAAALATTWFGRWGAPRYLVSDQGGAFTGQVLEEMASIWGYKAIRTSAYHPQTNGVEERTHRVLLDAMAAALNDKGLEPARWQEVVTDALLARRALVNRMTGFTPARLVLGDEIALPAAWVQAPTWRKWCEDKLAMRTPDEVRTAAVALDGKRQRQRMADIDKVLRAMDAAARQVSELDGSEGAEPGPADTTAIWNYQPGDYVRRWLGDGLSGDDEVLNAKLEPRRWSGPWRVAEVIRGVALLLTKADDPLEVATVAAARCKRVWLPEQKKEQYEELWKATMEQKERERERRGIIRERFEWRYESKDERDVVGVEEILQVKDKGKRKRVLVRWEDGSRTWEPAKIVTKDAPEKWEEWRKKNKKVPKKQREKEEKEARGKEKKSKK